MRKKLLAGVLVGLILLNLSGCGWFVDYFKLEGLFPTTTAPTTETTTEPTTEPTTVPTTVPTTAPTTAAPVTAPSESESDTETLPSDPAGTTDETEPSDASVPATDPEEPRVVGVSANGYQIVEDHGITYVNGVMIVNKSYSVPEDYAPGDLTPECKAAFKELVAAAAADGIQIFLLSGYRSYDLQTSLYNRYVSRDGQAAADTYSARPGHSEHQTGLALDVNSISYAFADTAEGQWLAANAHTYGFIIRYAKDKQDITGYAYEPWHIRYLGKGMAAAVYESGLTLEEYFGITSVYS